MDIYARECIKARKGVRPGAPGFNKPLGVFLSFSTVKLRLSTF
jgi:hypothetical protein